MATEYRLHGPPGTGKTWTLATTWVPQAAKRFGAGRVVICSLTRAAAKVIASRNTGVPRENIGTLHALCYRALNGPDVAEGYLDEWNRREPTMPLSADQEVTADNPFADRATGNRGDDLAAQAQALRHRRTPRHEWPQQVRYFQERWDDWLQETERTDFTGMIEACLESVDYAPGRPEVFIVDEAQDCSVLELSLVRKWAERASYVVLAGDGDQAIYQWRGASPDAFTGGDIPQEHNYHLTKSHRVPSRVHAIADEWIQQCSERYAVNYEPTEREGRVGRLPHITSKFPIQLVRQIEESLEAGRTAMVLASCAFVLRPTLRQLRSAGLPFHNPYRRTAAPWNPMRGGADRLRAFLLPAPGFLDSPRQWTLEDAARWADLVEMKRTSFGRGAKTRIKDAIKTADFDKREDRTISDAEGRLLFGADGWAELTEVIQGSDPLQWLADHCLASKRQLIEYGLTVSRRRGIQALRNEPQVVVGTVHSVKGGEADDVFLYPDLSVAGMKEWIRPGAGRDSIVRTMYVGMTRAKEGLFLLGRSSPRAVAWRR